VPQYYGFYGPSAGFGARGVSRSAGASAGTSLSGCINCGSPLNESRSPCIKIAPSQTGAMASAMRKRTVAIVVTVQARASAAKASVVSGHGPGPRKSRRRGRDAAVDVLFLGRSAITAPGAL
jgi:hypothetical protein